MRLSGAAVQRHFLACLLCLLTAVGCLSNLKAALGQAEGTAESEINLAKLTPEKLAEQFAVEWQDISANAHRNLKQQQITRSICLSGQLTLVKEESILGLDNNPQVSEAIDDSGREIFNEMLLKQANEVAGGRNFDLPHRLPNEAPWFGKLQPINIRVYLPITAGACPKRLRKLTANLNVLIGKTTIKEIRLEKSEDWTELSAGLNIRFKKCDVKDTHIDYELESICDAATREFRGYLGPEQILPVEFISRAALLDDNGIEHFISSTAAFRPHGSGSAGIGHAAKLVKMRFYVATDIHELAVPLTIKDLEIPTLADK